MSLTRTLAEFATGLTYGELPDDVRTKVKRLLLDSVGCALGGTRSEIGAAALTWAGGMGGRPVATLLGTSAMSDPHVAAYHNARVIGALDADEIYPGERQVSHHGAVVIAAALALAERSGLSGSDLITAVAAGYEIGARLCNATVPSHDPAQRLRAGWGPGGVIAAAMVSARLMEMPAEVAAHAAGLAGLHVDGPALQWTRVGPAPLVKSADGGWQALTGMLSADLARSGMTGYPDILDGEDGLWRALGYASFDAAAVTDGLGTHWATMNASLKAWPCQYWMHQTLTALAQILEDDAPAPGEIERISLHTTRRSSSARFTDRSPATELDRHFSLPHTAAMVVFDIPAGPEWGRESVAERPEVRRIRNLVDVDVDPRCDDYRVVEHVIRDMPAGATVAAGGRTLEATATLGRGSPWSEETRLSDADLEAKFRVMAGDDGSDQGVRSRIDALVAGLWSLEGISDVRELTPLLRA